MDFSREGSLARPEGVGDPLSPKRILVCDDEPSVCTALKLLLGALGHEVEIAQCAEEALRVFDAQPFDVVVTDFFMPGMDGGELARAIKTRNHTVPVIMVTGSLLAGPPGHVDAFLRKPFSVDEMRQAITQVSS